MRSCYSRRTLTSWRQTEQADSAEPFRPDSRARGRSRMRRSGRLRARPLRVSTTWTGRKRKCLVTTFEGIKYYKLCLGEICVCFCACSWSIKLELVVYVCVKHWLLSKFYADIYIGVDQVVGCFFLISPPVTTKWDECIETMTFNIYILDEIFFYINYHHIS